MTHRYTIEELENLLREREPRIEDFTKDDGSFESGDYYESLGFWKQRQHYAPMLIQALKDIAQLQGRIDAALAIPESDVISHEYDFNLGYDDARDKFRAKLTGGDHD